MHRRPLLLALSLVAAAITTLPIHSAQAEDRGAAALTRLRADAQGGLTVARGDDGRVRFVGTPAHETVHDPSVGTGLSAAVAARHHLDRYGAAFGGDPSSTYRASSSVQGAGGSKVVRFSQSIDDVPVLGGELVVTDDATGALESIAGGAAGSVSVSAATVEADRAEATARALVGRGHSHAKLTVTDLGRWIVDPALAGLDLPGGARTVRRLEVRGGAGVRELVLVDDHTGRPVFRTSLIEAANRVVCDDANTRSPESLCDQGMVRTETSGPTGVGEVDHAFAYAGEVDAFYQDISNGSVNVTTALGIDVNGTPALASTVRFCTNTRSNGVSYDDACPFANAFWDGQQMYYGDGYADADDVVGHEMTHGIVDQYSRLFYWGQSGAINESLADTMGEFIDHRNGVDDDSSWGLGEDLPGGALRNMADPVAQGQPDRMSSDFYAADWNYDDAGGVHTNSGVGNKTAYLISQGGTFNGQTITGIDVGDPTLEKSSRLYLQVIKTLPSGADYATLGNVLRQACATLLRAGTLTEADCDSVSLAVVATELSTPPNIAAPAEDADTSCPAGTIKRVLMDGESDAASKFAPVGNNDWTREVAAGTSNATSGTASWYGQDPGGSTASSAWIQTDPLRAAVSTALPAGQPSYLSFQNWYLLDYDGNTSYYDGGTVEVGVDGGVPTAGSTLSSDWINGPDRIIAGGSGNAWQGLPAFSGDSHGWSLSRLDLTPWAGHTVRPQFTVRTDNQFGMIGWYLDDIQIYTCDPPPGPVTGLTNTAVARSSATDPIRHRVTWHAPTVNPASVTGYRIYVDAIPIKTVAPSTRTYALALDTTRSHTVTVRSVAGNTLGPSVAVKTTTSVLTLAASRSGTTVALHGSLKRGGTAFSRRAVWIERKSGSGWVTAGSATTTSSGAFSLKVKRSTAAYYRARFSGATGVTGRFSASVKK